MKGSAGAVTTLFVALLLLVIVPSRMMALARAGTIAGFLGATTSTLLVCWFLYRLCLRATRQAWYIGISIAAVYVATFSAPFFAWCALLVLYLVHRHTVRHLQAASRADAPPETISPVAEEPEGAAVEPGPAPSWVQVVDLDTICGSYRRILFSQRFVRAATASLAGTAVITIPVMFVFAVYDFRAPLFGIVAGVVVAVFLALVCTLYFAWLRALWRGSIRAARIGVVATASFAVLWLLVGAIRFNREMLVTGGIWFELTAQAMQLSLIAAMGAGSAVIVWRQRDVALRGLLAQNARHDWRAALLQLCGVVLSSGRALTALTRRSFVLSALAFSIEGFAFYVYFKAASNVLKLSDSLPSSFGARMSPLEGHYFSLVTVICLVLPVTYVSTQLTLAGAERLRTIARRASLRRAEDLLQEDGRPPVLFLRDFKDDQVSLERASVPAWIRVLDPGLEQANMEDVLQACLNIGPAVAIGRPEDVRPPIGAARRYVQGDGWKDIVLAMMNAAAVVVVGASDSPGVTWEVEQLRDQGHLDRTIFVMPPAARRNHLLARGLVATLTGPAEPLQEATMAAELTRAVGSRRITGMTFRQGIVRIYVTNRPPSQVEFDATLRLARPDAQAANAIPLAVSPNQAPAAVSAAT